jgi:hypothetical protein
MANSIRESLRSDATSRDSDPLDGEGQMRTRNDWIVILALFAGACLWSVTFWPRFGP